MLKPNTLTLLSSLSKANTLAEVIPGILEIALKWTQAHGVRLYMPEPRSDLREVGRLGYGFGLFETEEVCFEVYITHEPRRSPEHAHLPVGKGEVWAVLELIFPETKPCAFNSAADMRYCCLPFP